jgi:hypothetical protein
MGVPRIRVGGVATPSPSQLISPGPCTGFGLSIVREIVQGIGGSVTAENRAERGAVLNLVQFISTNRAIRIEMPPISLKRGRRSVQSCKASESFLARSNTAGETGDPERSRFDVHETLTLPPAAIDVTADGSLRRWYRRRMRAHRVPTGAIPI